VAAMMRTRKRGPRKTDAAPEEEAAVLDTQEAGEAQVDQQVEEVPPAPERRRYIINLNMLSNVDVKFYTEGATMQDVIGHWRAAIGRAKREQPEDAVEVVMGVGEGATSYILYLAEVTAFAVGPFVDDSDAIDYTVNV
jgi:hypothetical protein